MNLPFLLKMQNEIKTYDWGHPSALWEIVNRESSGQKGAELWMGAHSGGPSKVTINGEEKSLYELVKAHPLEFLGQQLTQKNTTELPFLLKLLAIDKPLSIQLHPDKTTAMREFEVENKQNIALNAFNRNYKDPNHKPELVVAVEDMKVLARFEDDKMIVRNLKIFQIPEIDAIVKEFENQKFDKKCLVKAILDLKQLQNFADIMKSVVQLSMRINGIVSNELLKANKHYPGDVGILFLLILKLHYLQQGQAMYVGAGIMHAYVSGQAVEIMANSDNVLRCGLTPKHVDQQQLIAILNQSATVKKFDNKDNTTKFDCQLEDFGLIRLENTEYEVECNAPIIVFALNKDCIINLDKFESIQIQKGESVFIRPNDKKATIKCSGTTFIATVGEK